MTDLEKAKWLRFQAPREIDRYLYCGLGHIHRTFVPFPAPREVDRYLYWLRLEIRLLKVLLSFRPLAREIGSYKNGTGSMRKGTWRFRPLAR